MNKRISSFLNGAGFYIVLFLSIAIIGVSGYSIYHAIFPKEPAVPPQDAAALSEHPLKEKDPFPLPQSAEQAPASKPVVNDEKTVTVSGTTTVPAAKPASKADPAAPAVVRPLDGTVVTPHSTDTLIFNETLSDWRTHCGIDIAAEEGAPVVSAAAGRILSVTEDYWLGVTVTAKTEDGCELTYSNLQNSPDVAAGDTVKPGDPIGKVGTSSLLEEAVGPHLHFSVSKHGEAIDPERYLPKLA